MRRVGLPISVISVKTEVTERQHNKERVALQRVAPPEQRVLWEDFVSGCLAHQVDISMGRRSFRNLISLRLQPFITYLGKSIRSVQARSLPTSSEGWWMSGLSGAPVTVESYRNQVILINLPARNLIR